MPGTTSYPAALDTFPEIGPNTPENGAGTEHDVVHANEMAAIAALQAKVGVDGSADPASLDARMAAVESDKLDAAEVGVSVASLVGGLVPASQLPSFVDDVLEYADLASFPATGESGKIYVAGDDGKTYRWSGTVYIEISPSPGSTDGLVEGSLNLYHTAQRVRDVLLAGLSTATNAAIAAGDSLLVAFGKLQAQLNALFARQINTTGPLTGGGDLSSDRTLGITEATAAAAGSMSAADKSKLDGIAAGATAYSDAAARAAVIASAIASGDTTHAPSGDVVSAALDAKYDKTGGTINGAATVTGDFTAGTTAGGSVFTVLRPGSTPAGSSLQLSSPGAVVGFVGRTGTTSRIDVRLGANLLQLGVAASDSTPSVQMDITPTAVRPGSDNFYTFGEPGRRWKEFFGANATINTSDAREKTPLRPLTEAELAVARDLAGMIGLFQWLASIEEKGEEEARLHVGLIAQQVIAAFEAQGLDAFRYGAVCYDEWPETVEPAEYETVEITPAVTRDHPAIYERTQVYTDDGQPERFAERLVSPAWTEVIEPAVTEQRLVRAEVVHPAGNGYGLRGVQIALLIAAGQAQELAVMRDRVAALEAA